MDLKKHILEHEILGISDCGSSVSSQIQIQQGMLWLYDEEREKWLSVSRPQLLSTRKKAKNAYLRAGEGVALFETGFKMIRDGMITNIAVSTSNSVPVSWDLKIRKNNLFTDLDALPVTGNGNIIENRDIEFSKEDLIQVYCDTGNYLIEDIIVLLEIAWILT